MNAAEHERVRAVFAAVCDLDPDAQSLAIAQHCGPDAALRREVECLLELDRPSGGLLDESRVARGDIFGTGDGLGPGRRPLVLDDDDLPPHIGPYRVLGRLGEGGMGSVLLAEQSSPRRRVALKLLRAAAPGLTLRRRFLVEGQVLARLQHPGIATIHDAGVWDRPGLPAVPYLVMDFVDGQPITDHAIAHELSIAQRVELMIRVCEAVNEAHQKGIVHRDLKPDNVLVEDDGNGGQPKILDFGVAKVLGDDLEVTTAETLRGQLVGTLPYMSPEQVEGNPDAVDGRTDVYALGIMLHELLTGTLPYDFADRSTPEMAMIIRDTRPTPLGRSDRRLRGDLEVVVATALEKRTADRYASVADFAADLRHWINDEPVTARPPSATEQVLRFARRQRALVAGLAALLLTLTGGIVGTTRFAMKATERDRAGQWVGYRASIEAANAAVDRGDRETALRLLDAAPEHLRGWEWHAVRRDVDAWTTAIALDEEAVGAAWFLADGTQLAAGLANGTIGVWDADSGARVRTIPVGSDRPHGADDGPMTATTSTTTVVRGHAAATSALARMDDGTVRVVPLFDDAPSYAVPGVRLIDRDGLALAPGGCELAVARRGTVQRLSLRGELIDELSAERGTPNRTRLTYATDGRAIAVSTRATHQNRWRTHWYSIVTPEASEMPWRVPGLHRTSLAVRPDREGVVAAAVSRDLRLHDPDDDQTRVLTGHRTDVVSIALTPDGSAAASLALDGVIRVHDLASGRVVARMTAPPGAHAIAVSPDGTRLVTTATGVIHVWPIAPSRGRVLAGHDTYVYAATFAPDGRTIVTVPFRLEPGRLWDGHTGALLGTLPTNWRATGASFHAGGASLELLRGMRRRTVAFGSGEDGSSGRIDAASTAWTSGPVQAARDRVVHLGAGWVAHGTRSLEGERTSLVVRPIDAADDADDAANDARTFEHEQPVMSVAATPDGTQLVTGDAEGGLRIIDLANGQDVARATAPGGIVYGLAVSPDGTRLASGSNDGAVRIWSMPELDLVLELRGHTSYVHGVAWSPDGTRLVSASGDRTARLWDTIVRDAPPAATSAAPSPGDRRPGPGH